jgi:hypothetical protein
MKNFSIMILAGMILLSTSCKKYEDGPSISFLSKKSRICGIWKIESVYYNGINITQQNSYFYSSSIYEFDIDKNFVYSFPTCQGSFQLIEGNWELDSQKESITMKSESGAVLKEMKILRLKAKEMWVMETNGRDEIETHLRSI